MKPQHLYQLRWMLNVHIAWQGHDAASSSGAQGATKPDACRPASGRVIQLNDHSVGRSTKEKTMFLNHILI